MRRLFAVLTCAALLTPGCASTGAARVQAPESPVDRGLLASYVRKLPIGSHVRVALSDGHTLKGTLMKASDTDLVVQRRTRVPEPPDQVPLSTVSSVELDSDTGSAARAIWVGAAAGAGGALAVFLILAAIFAGD
jgi:hypothetical protein